MLAEDVCRVAFSWDMKETQYFGGHGFPDTVERQRGMSFV
jgi:hypothetical protein